MNNIRVGVIGIGNMGSAHARTLSSGAIPGAVLTAVCDAREQMRSWTQEHLSAEVPFWNDSDELIRSGTIDAVLLATPHYDHARLAVLAFDQGLHVLVEKPAGVTTSQVRRMNEAAAKAEGSVFAIMYNQRTNPLYIKLKDLIQSGELGEIRRLNWIITNWYRSQSYYDSSSWRATWSGEGGGVLVNQCPHQLDLLQWTTGMMPKRIRAFCQFGKYRDIEVEDDVTAYAEYENGATAVFITTTGEAPGTNRFEVTGDRGKIVIENNQLSFWRLREPEPAFNARFQGGFGQPECWRCDVPVEGEETGHPGIIANWIAAIREDVPLIAPGNEGIRGLTLSNAMLLSTWTDGWVDLPFDESQFDAELQQRVQHSNSVKKSSNADQAPADIQKSFK
ncbi:Gfo/Idh/MocA family oxidoreductase [Paenibacillus sp. JX-17]|uniref:Gfo/Idh/MocA family oxidoreductase n=1 Tax=Paenibacillus lacisoli TaxID=3064525 RepID=A0ABT9CFF3_9BACL|nr:Gfo/Idh/MocA family oxidoreductase [Paenibacillus sp. JX-17]MDO7907987.1 Gfo/Idh/MocA family oxidoreductase [Paenibacillus sp. JX-17]